MNKLSVAVLMGGFSAEREVSIKSGQAVSQALRNIGHDVIQVNDIEALKQIPKSEVDVVFNILHGADEKMVNWLPG